MSILTNVTIYQGHVGLHFRKGALVGQLPTGRHVFWGRDHRVLNVDLRPSEAVIGGQEIATRDGGTLRVSVIVTHWIADAVRYYESGQLSSPDDNPFGITQFSTQGLHHLAQIALREWVMARTFDEAYEHRLDLADAVHASLTERAGSLGMAVESTRLLEFAIVGSLRTAYADLLKTEIEGKASLARARNEAATMRNLLNTARLVREHPGLLELRVLSSGQRPKVTFVVGNPPNGRSVADVASEAIED